MNAAARINADADMELSQLEELQEALEYAIVAAKCVRRIENKYIILNLQDMILELGADIEELSAEVCAQAQRDGDDLERWLRRA